ncbi:unnamed protein product [Heterobilharzia americana]|nr:unnamed protein product [Heterobilharzia americana]
MIVVIMGPCGCGKSTIGSALSSRIFWPFIEGDDYHPESNRIRMSLGTPLNDEDRLPWLQRLKTEFSQYKNAVVACSALKQSYRNILSDNDNENNQIRILFVLLQADKNLLQQRINNRKGHFIHPTLVQSQLEILEPFGKEEENLIIDANESPNDIIQQIMKKLTL